jgi:glutamine synthetase type III
MIKAINKVTGEVINLPTRTFDDIVSAWQFASAYEKTAKELKNQLKLQVPIYINSNGLSDEWHGQAFRMSNVQRMTYDKTVLRDNVDEDTFDTLTIVDKSLTDTYLKENLESLGERSTIIRSAMIPLGKPYTVIKLEKLTR